MKTYILLALGTIVVLGATIGGYAYYVKHTSTELCVLIDITDSSSASLDTTEIPMYISHSISAWSETKLSFSSLSNFQNNKKQTLYIEPAFPLFANPNKRKKQIEKQLRKVDETITGIKRSSGRETSILFVPIIRAAEALSKGTSKRKALIVYTDAKENTDYFSVYTAKDSVLVFTHPKEIKERIERQINVETLEGVTLIFVYDAPTPEDEKVFLHVTAIWKEILEAHHAKVVITPSLSTLQNYAQ